MSEPITTDVPTDARQNGLPPGVPEPDPNVTLQFCLEKNILGISGCKYCSGLTPGIRNYDLEPGSADAPHKSERCDEERLIGGVVRKMLEEKPTTDPE